MWGFPLLRDLQKLLSPYSTVAPSTKVFLRRGKKKAQRECIFFFFSCLVFVCELLSVWNFADVVLEVLKDMPAWPGRHLLEGGENRRYFGLKTVMRGVVEFECTSQREYDIWTQGVSRLLSVAAERSTRHRM